MCVCVCVHVCVCVSTCTTTQVLATTIVVAVSEELWVNNLERLGLLNIVHMIPIVHHHQKTNNHPVIMQLSTFVKK